VLALITALALVSATDAEVAAAQALELYRAKAYAAAARRFDDAWHLSRKPTQLHNAAKSYSKAGELETALDRWRRYLLLDLPKDKRELAEESAASLRARIDTQRTKDLELEARAPPTPGVAIETAAPPPAEDSVAPYVLGGLGGAAIAGGVGLYFSGWATYWDAESAGAPTIFPEDADAARLRSGVGIGLAAVGVAAVVAAILWEL